MVGVFELLILLVVIPGIIFWVWMLAECATRESDAGNARLVWVVIILFAGIIGAAIYFFARRPQRRAELGR